MIYPYALSEMIEKLERIMESDKRNFNNRITDEDWYFDKVYAALKILKQLEDECNERLERI